MAIKEKDDDKTPLYTQKQDPPAQINTSPRHHAPPRIGQTAARQLDPTAPHSARCCALRLQQMSQDCMVPIPGFYGFYGFAFAQWKEVKMCQPCLILFHSPRPRPIPVDVGELPPDITHSWSCYLP